MFKKIVIANRGEIAVRIMATCRELGIRTVAVYSAADRTARHVREADEAYEIGPAPASESYLKGAKILDVVRRSGAEAIHPGYGFLSENADFAEACEQAGVVFIGPSAAAMRLMGAKISAKQLAASVDVPTVPGYDGSEQDEAVLAREAQRIGFPLLIKASAGGGGKGMRAVEHEQDLLEQLRGARREAQAAFGDATVFLERLLQRPRHVEIQIIADQHGNLLSLGERECSIQRRHQKILEESPSPVLTPMVRAAMSEAALRLVRAAGYVNAGTLEFLLDHDHAFYFLEMNTRLQVEHPVTELVTGLDLVRLQLSVAAGERLPLTQEQVRQRGHAIEVRLYAEDPAQQFLPSTGTVSTFITPEGPGIRVDSGIADGDEITQYYDPMIAKLIVYGTDREAATARLRTALEQGALFGVTTNSSLLHAISTHPAFLAGDTHTGFLDEHGLLGIQPDRPLPDEVLLAAALDAVRAEPMGDLERQALNPWKTLGPWQMIGATRILTYTYQGQTCTAMLRPVPDANQTWEIQIGTRSAGRVRGWYGPRGLVIVTRDEQQLRTYVHRQTQTTQVVCYGESYTLQRRLPPDVTTTAQSGGTIAARKTLTAPMAGTIVKVLVQAGERVTAHQVLMILSAMKMEHAITAPYAGTVQRVLYQEGAVVQGGAIVAEIAEIQSEDQQER